jgi:hypothetical protein
LFVFILIPVALHLIYINKQHIFAFLPSLVPYNRYYVLLVVSLLLPGAVISIARSAALEQAKVARVANREVARFTFKTECAGGELQALNDAGKLRVLAATDKWYFTFAPTGELKNGRISSIDLFHVAQACVQSVEFFVRHPE